MTFDWSWLDDIIAEQARIQRESGLTPEVLASVAEYREEDEVWDAQKQVER